MSVSTFLIVWTCLCSAGLVASAVSAYKGHWFLGIVGVPFFPLAVVGAFGVTKPNSLRAKRLARARLSPA